MLEITGVLCKPDGNGGTYAELHFNENIGEKEIQKLFCPRTSELSDYVTVKEAADMLHVSKQAVYQMAERANVRRFTPAHAQKGLRVNIKDLEKEMLAGVYE